MDWDLAIKRNSEALKEIIAGLFAMLELAGGITVARLPQLRPQRRAAGALAGRIRPAAPDRHRGPRPCGEACLPASGLTSQACGSNQERRGLTSLLPALRSAEEFPGVAPTPHKIREASAAYPFLPRPFPGGRPVASAPARSRSRSAAPMAWSMPSPSPGGSRPSSPHSRICRARPGALPAGGQGARPCQARSSDRRSGLALLPATAGSPFTWSMRCSSNAMASPGTR